MMDDTREISTRLRSQRRLHTLHQSSHTATTTRLQFLFKQLQFLVPLLILGVAFGIRFYGKSASS
ncbi:hypothetical protein LINPERHAP2_LOCUS21240 [Linum perenne]